MDQSSLNIPVMLGSIRKGRKSEQVAILVHAMLSKLPGVMTELIDLKSLNLPVMEERVRFDPDAPEGAKWLARRLSDADGLIVVSPEYNWGIPGSVKNAFDFLGLELKRKPVGLVSVSNGGLGGLQLAVQFRSLVASQGAILVPQLFPVTRVTDGFDPEGNPLDEMFAKRADKFFEELLWLAEALKAKRRRS